MLDLPFALPDPLSINVCAPPPVCDHECAQLTPSPVAPSWVGSVLRDLVEAGVHEESEVRASLVLASSLPGHGWQCSPSYALRLWSPPWL